SERDLVVVGTDSLSETSLSHSLSRGAAGERERGVSNLMASMLYSEDSESEGHPTYAKEEVEEEYVLPPHTESLSLAGEETKRVSPYEQTQREREEREREEREMQQELEEERERERESDEEEEGSMLDIEDDADEEEESPIPSDRAYTLLGDMNREERGGGSDRDLLSVEREAERDAARETGEHTYTGRGPSDLTPTPVAEVIRLTPEPKPVQDTRRGGEGERERERESHHLDRERQRQSVPWLERQKERQRERQTVTEREREMRLPVAQFDGEGERERENRRTMEIPRSGSDRPVSPAEASRDRDREGEREIETMGGSQSSVEALSLSEGYASLLKKQARVMALLQRSESLRTSLDDRLQAALERKRERAAERERVQAKGRETQLSKGVRTGGTETEGPVLQQTLTLLYSLTNTAGSDLEKQREKNARLQAMVDEDKQRERRSGRARTRRGQERPLNMEALPSSLVVAKSLLLLSLYLYREPVLNTSNGNRG
ncbi:hypothetical protein KIPB_000995, partial [Kipferlia bialata]